LINTLYVLLQLQCVTDMSYITRWLHLGR